MAVSVGYTPSVTPAIGIGSTAVAGDEDNTEYWSLSKCKRAYLDYLGTKNEEIVEQQAARCYRHGAQWTTSQVEILNKRKQPVVTYNRIGRKIDSIVGLMEKLKQSPKAYPRNPQMTDEQGAELATAVVRYVIEANLVKDKFPFAIETGAIDGIGGIEMMLIEGDKGDQDVGFALVQSDSFFYDPRSYLHDFEDARFMGQGKWMDIDDAKEMFPDHAEDLGNLTESGTGEGLTSNPDREKRWFQTSKEFKRIRVVDIWYRHDGGWCWCMFTGSQKLGEGRAYFYDEKGQEICKYLMFSSFIDHDGDRYGFIRGLRSSQDEINQRRSKGLHELMSRRIKAEDGAFADIEVTRREAVRPDGVVVYTKGFEMEFDDAARMANIEGQLKFLEDAKNEIENFGPNPALIGQGLEYKSGRAINLLQQAGIAELGPFVIGVRNWKLRIYRAIWAAVQRYWTAERWIRVTDDEGLAQQLQVNGVGVDEYGMPQAINSMGQLDVNFVLDEGPDEVNQMGDAYDTLIALSSQGAKVPPEILIELSPVGASTKRKLLALLSKPDPIADQAKQVALAAEGAKVAETQSKTHLNEAKAAEVAQGGAHGIIERQMDASMAQDEHRMKLVEGQAKIQGDRQKAQIGAETEFMKLRSAEKQADLKIKADVVQTGMKLQQSEEIHQQKMTQMRQQAAAKPAPKGPKK